MILLLPFLQQSTTDNMHGTKYVCLIGINSVENTHSKVIRVAYPLLLLSCPPHNVSLLPHPAHAVARSVTVTRSSGSRAHEVAYSRGGNCLRLAAIAVD